MPPATIAGHILEKSENKISKKSQLGWSWLAAN